jgi:hypothetical protein
MRLLVAPLAVLVLFAGTSSADESPAPVPAPGAPSALMYDPDFREGKPEDALTNDADPLRRGHLDAYVDLFEAGYDLAFSATEEQALRDAMESTWPADRLPALKWSVQRAAVVASAKKGEVAETKRLLGNFVEAQEARIAAAPAAAQHRPLVQARTRARTVFSPGQPPVSVGAQEAFEELVLFLMGVARNETPAVTDGQRAALREKTKASVDKTGGIVRAHYARMPRFWRQVKARWDTADDAAKLRMRSAAVRAFRWMLGLASSPAPDETTPRDLTTYAAAAKEIAAAKVAYDAYTIAFQNPQAVIAAAVEGMGLDPADLEKAFSVEPLLLR